jgi:hypothetical protein
MLIGIQLYREILDSDLSVQVIPELIPNPGHSETFRPSQNFLLKSSESGTWIWTLILQIIPDPYLEF